MAGGVVCTRYSVLCSTVQVYRRTVKKNSTARPIHVLCEALDQEAYALCLLILISASVYVGLFSHCAAVKEDEKNMTRLGMGIGMGMGIGIGIGMSMMIRMMTIIIPGRLLQLTLEWWHVGGSKADGS